MKSTSVLGKRRNKAKARCLWVLNARRCVSQSNNRKWLKFKDWKGYYLKQKSSRLRENSSEISTQQKVSSVMYVSNGNGIFILLGSFSYLEPTAPGHIYILLSHLDPCLHPERCWDSTLKIGHDSAFRTLFNQLHRNLSSWYSIRK